MIDLKNDNHFSLKTCSFPFPHHKSLTLAFLTTVSAVTPIELEHPI